MKYLYIFVWLASCFLFAYFDQAILASIYAIGGFFGLIMFEPLSEESVDQ